MCLKFLFDARFWNLLFRIDEDLAREAREDLCPFCGEVLHSACWRRKPQVAKVDLPKEQRIRFSFCCSHDRCRRRVTPPSLRFLGRKVFLSVTVSLVTSLRQGPTPRGLRKLERVFGISRRTIARWQKWWKESFQTWGFWKELKARLSRSSVLPLCIRSLIAGMNTNPSPRELLRLLRSLSQHATGQCMLQPDALAEYR